MLTEQKNDLANLFHQSSEDYEQFKDILFQRRDLINSFTFLYKSSKQFKTCFKENLLKTLNYLEIFNKTSKN